MVARILDITTATKLLQSLKGFDRVVNKLKFLTLANGKCSVEIIVDESHTNPMGVLHGGFAATLVDFVSTAALMTQVQLPHATVDMHLSYLKAAKIGDELLVDANVVRKGKTLAFLEMEVKEKRSGDLLVKGSQTKFIL